MLVSFFCRRGVKEVVLSRVSQFHEQFDMRLRSRGAPPDDPAHGGKTAQQKKETAEGGNDKPVHGRRVHRVSDRLLRTDKNREG